MLVLDTSAKWALRPFGVHEVIAGDSVRNAQELRAIVDEADVAGVIPRAQEEMLHSVFDFADREAADVMVPTPDVVWLDAGLALEEALDRVADRPYSRYPVGEGSLDRLAGVIHVRDLIAAARTQPTAAIRAFVHPTFVVPETEDLGALCASCARFQRGARHALGRRRRPHARRPGVHRGRPPAAGGDEVHVNGARLRVEQLDGNRITRLLVEVEPDRCARLADAPEPPR